MSFGYDKEEISIAGIYKIAFISVVLLIIVLVTGSLFFSGYKDNLYYELVLEPKSEKLTDLHQKEEIILENYGLIDEGEGIFRIPIDQAMQLVLDERTAP